MPRKRTGGEMRRSKAEERAGALMYSRPSHQQFQHATGHRKRVEEEQPAHVDEQERDQPSHKPVAGKPVGDGPAAPAEGPVIGTDGQPGTVIEAPEEEVQPGPVPEP